MKKIISVFTSLAITFTLFFVFPSDLKVSAITASEVTQAITNLKNSRYYEGYCWNNEYSDAEATKKFNGSQCVGFARNVGNIVFGSFPNSRVSNYKTGQTLNGWTAIRGNDVTSVEPGDIIRTSGHAAIVHYVNGDNIYVAEAWGSSGNTIHYGYFNGTKNNATLAKIKANNTFLGIWRHPAYSNIVPTACSIELSGFQNPTDGYKHTPGANCGLYGTITSSHTLKHVWGGVYNLDGTKAPGSSTVCDDYPNSTSYSLRGTFNNTVIFDDIPEGHYFFSISAEDSDGYKKELIHNEFTVGNPAPISQGHIMSESEGAGRTIPDGDYIICSGLNQNYYLDVPGFGDNLVATANVQMWINGDINTISSSDVWTITYLNNGFYSIRSTYNKNLSLDIADASLNMSTNVQIQKYVQNNAQQFSILPTDTGYKIQARCGAYCLDVTGAKVENTTNVQVYEDNNSKAQRFVFIPYFDSSKPLENGIYTIKTAVSDGWYIDVSGNIYDPYKNSSNIQIWDGKTDMFYLESQGNGYYRIREITSGLYLEVVNSNNTFANQAVNVILYEKTSSRGQLWYLKKVNNNYVLLNQLSGYPLDMAIDKIDASLLKQGGNINQFTYHGKLNQQWQFEKATLDSLSIIAPKKINYLVGEEIDTSGLSVKANFSNGMKLDVTKFIKYDYNYDKTTAGKKDIRVSYTVEGQTISNTFSVNYENIKISSLEISSKPSKLEYKVNEKIDTTGLKLKATYNNGETKEITSGFEVSYDFSSIGKKEVTVSYEGKSVKYEVDVTYSDLTLNITDRTENSIAMEWNEIETADNYKIELTYSDEEGTVIKKKYNSAQPEYIFEKLNANTEYTITVTSFNADTEINSAAATVKTLPFVSFKGEGTEESPYQIATKEDLFTLAALVNDIETNTKYGSAYYIQTADIDLENELFEPIGTRMKDGKDLSKPLFGGNYNGQGHEIKNLYVNKTDGRYAGLFGSLKGNLAIENLTVYGEVSSNIGCAGGIAGEVVNGGGMIKNCAFIGNVTGEHEIGGITGVIYQNGSVENCYHIGNVSSTNEEECYGLGGIVGQMVVGDHVSGNSILKNCYNIGDVNGNSQTTGGIVGIMRDANKVEGEIHVSNCYYLKDDCETGSNGEATECEINALTPNLMKKIADDLGEPFVTNTNPDLNNGYPVFEWQLNPVVDEPDILFGDVNNDGEINLKDVVLIRRYIVGGWDVDINEAAADVNHDEAINLKDVVMIRRYIVGGWDVELNG